MACRQRASRVEFPLVTGALDLQTLTVADLARPDHDPTAVRAGATMADVRAATRATGHLRVLVGARDDLVGVVHVRDTLTRSDDEPVDDLVRPLLTLDAAMPVYEALTQMRETRQHLAVLREDGRFAGVVTLDDLLREVLPGSAEAGAAAGV